MNFALGGAVINGNVTIDNSELNSATNYTFNGAVPGQSGTSSLQINNSAFEVMGNQYGIPRRFVLMQSDVQNVTLGFSNTEITSGSSGLDVYVGPLSAIIQFNGRGDNNTVNFSNGTTVGMFSGHTLVYMYGTNASINLNDTAVAIAPGDASADPDAWGNFENTLMSGGKDATVTIANSSITGSTASAIAMGERGFKSIYISGSTLSGYNKNGTVAYLQTDGEQPAENASSTVTITDSVVSSTAGSAVSLQHPNVADHAYTVSVDGSSLGGATNVITDNQPSGVDYSGNTFDLDITDGSKVTATDTNGTAIQLASQADVTVDNSALNGNVVLGGSGG